MSQTRRRGPAGAPNTDSSTAATAVMASKPRPCDRRVERARRRASRLLDAHLGIEVPPLVLGEPIDWADSYMDRGVPERDHRGRELDAAGWVP